MLAKLLSFITNPLADIIGNWQARKTIAAETQAEVIRTKAALEVAKLQAEIRRAEHSDQRDSDYDLEAQRQRRDTYADEFLILFFFGLFALHFIPDMQPYMMAGWAAVKQAPLYFEFAIVGIVVATFGLMRLFRVYKARLTGRKQQ